MLDSKTTQNEHEFHYIFSGSLSQEMIELLVKIPEYEPIDVLVSQLDRSAIKKMIEYQDNGWIASLFIDSGAYTHHSQGTPLDVDEYIQFVNGMSDRLIAVAQVDKIPGTFKKPKSKEDYVESAELSWENYLYMRERLNCPEKLIPVFHFGESFEALGRMLRWTDEQGNHIEYLGISPANDTDQSVKDIFLRDVYDKISRSPIPNVKTHLFGMTSLQALSKFPCYSADSVSHRLRTGYNKIYTRKWGTISLSDKTRTSKTKSNMSFLQLCDKATYKEFETLVRGYGFEVEEVKESVSKRVVVDMMETIKAYKGEYAYKPGNFRKSKKLFKLE